MGTSCKSNRGRESNGLPVLHPLRLMQFVVTSIIISAFLIAASVCVVCVVPKHDKLWRKLPRERTFGIIIGIISLCWSAMEVRLMLEGGLIGLRKLLPFVVAGTSVASYMMLDYLFTRALGGLLLLVCGHMLHEAFAVFLPVRWLYALILYVVGVIGMFMIGSPYRFRDWLEKVTFDARWRCLSGALLALGGAVILVIALCYQLQTQNG